MDDTNRRILRILLDDGQATFDEIGERLGRAKTTIRDRVKKMEKDGVIRGYHADVSLEALGYTTRAFVFGNLPLGGERTVDKLLTHPSVHEVLYVTGDRRVVFHVVAADNAHLRRIVQDVILPVGVTDVESRVIMERRSGGIPTDRPPSAVPPSRALLG